MSLKLGGGYRPERRALLKVIWLCCGRYRFPSFPQTKSPPQGPILQVGSECAADCQALLTWLARGWIGAQHLQEGSAFQYTQHRFPHLGIVLMAGKV